MKQVEGWGRLLLCRRHSTSHCGETLCRGRAVPFEAKEVGVMSESTVASSATGQTWDYKLLSVHARHNDKLEETLKELGGQGWDLVFVSEEAANEFRLIFKKPLA
jgi:hypothetical protein